MTEQNKSIKFNMNDLKSKVLDESINAVAIIDLDWEIIYANNSLLKFWHYNNFNEVIGQNILKFGGGTKERSHSILSKIVAKGFSIGEHRYRTREGKIFIGQMSGTLIKNAENEPIYVLLEFVDITERKLIEQKLKESEQKFRNIAEQSLMGIAIVQDGIIKYANETMAEISGYSTKKLMNWSKNEFLRLIHPESLEFAKEQSRKKQLGEEDVVRNYQFRIITKTNNVKWIDNYSQSTLYEGKFANLVSWIDITERRKAEEKLKESEQKFRNFAEQSLMGIAIVQDGIIKYANETIAKIVGYTTKELMNWSENEFTKLFHPESLDFATDQAKKKQLGEEDIVRRYQLKIITKKGDVKWVENHSQSTLYEGKFANLVSWINITERRKAEENLKESEQNYREAFDRTTFYKDLLTHDMNNILQVIQLTLEISSVDKNISLKLKESLESIKNQVLRASKLISNVQKLSQLEESQELLKIVDIYDVLKDSINFLKKSFALKKINVKVNTSREHYLVNANNILREVFENILINAVKYNENSTVEIMIKFSEERKVGINYIKLEFMDNGRGIPDSIKKIIFHKGFLEEKQSEGMGIGLTLVKKAIETYNGQIWVEDRITGDYSKGSNFIIMIPEAA